MNILTVKDPSGNEIYSSEVTFGSLPSDNDIAGDYPAQDYYTFSLDDGTVWENTQYLRVQFYTNAENETFLYAITSETEAGIERELINKL